MIPTLEMHYSWLGFGYALLSALGRLFAEKWFDIVLALAGTLLGYLLAKRHIEHFISGIVEEQPDISIYDWNTGVAVYRHASMREMERTPTSIEYSWMWDMQDVPCGLYVGVVNFTVGGMVKTGSPIGDRVKIFLKRAGEQVTKVHETVPWA